MHEYKIKVKGEEMVFSFETGEEVFHPTGTSDVLIKACRDKLEVPQKTLDLGCGVGLTGLVTAKLGLCSEPLYASDISEAAVQLAQKNAERLGVELVSRSGSLFEPWYEERFDVIIDDVSGVSEEIARISPWFPEGVHCGAGRDGTKWILTIIEQSTLYLKEKGKLIFPVLSLSNEEKILSSARKYFSHVELLRERMWNLPPEMEGKIEEILPLIEDNSIRIEKKWGKWVWQTKIFLASDPVKY